VSFKETAKKAIDDVDDAVHEIGHRGAAEAERAKREAAGDNMTLGEKTQSVVNEGSNRVAAEVDRVKRDVRDKT
jgi:gas vesicle protein